MITKTKTIKMLLYDGCNKEQEQLSTHITIAAKKISPDADFAEKELLQQYCSDPKYAELLLEILSRLIEQEKEKQSHLASQKAKLEMMRREVTIQLEKGKVLNQQFADYRESYDALHELLAKQDEIEEMQEQLTFARNAQHLRPAHALLKNTEEQIKLQRQELQKAELGMSEAAKQIPLAETGLNEALSHQEEADTLLQQARLLEELIPTLGEMRKLQKDQQKMQADLLAISAESLEADTAYGVAKEAYYLSQAGILASTLEANKPCPVCGSTVHPHPARLSTASVTREELDAAEKRRRDAEGRLSDTSEKLAALSAKIAADEKRLAAFELDEKDTELTVRKKANELNRKAQQYREAIDTSRKLLQDFQLQFRENEAKVQGIQKQIETLVSKLSQQQQEFEEGLAAYGFDDSEDFELAIMTESAMAKLEKAIRLHNEQKQSLKDQVSKLEEKLANKEPVDLSMQSVAERNHSRILR